MRILSIALMFFATAALADPPSITAVKATASGSTWTFSVTIRHADTGWDHYADGWEVITADGMRLGHRELLHPPVDEQPFTRPLSGVVIPKGVSTVYVRASCNTTGWSSKRFKVDLKR